jgi:AcrR family transcriptional regulator
VTTTTVRHRARRGEGDRLRGEILAAAQALLLETADTSAVSIRAIADRVGVTAPSIYRHFADKDALMMAVCAGVFDQLDDALEKAGAGAADPFEELCLKGRAYVEFGVAHPEHYRLIFMIKHEQARNTASSGAGGPAFDPTGGLPLDGDAPAGSAAFAHLQDTVHRAIERRHASVDPPDEFAMTCAVWSAVHGITSLRISLPHFPWPSVEQQLELVVSPWEARLRARRAPRARHTRRPSP